MEINKLADLNSLRTAPLLSSIQENKLLGELETNIEISSRNFFLCSIFAEVETLMKGIFMLLSYLFEDDFLD